MKSLMASLVLILVAHSPCSASSVYRDSLDALLRYSSDSAVIRISSKKEVTFAFQGRSRVCGYLYSADVLERFKGQSASISFFFVSDEVKVGNRYLILGFPVEATAAREAASSVIAKMDALERAEHECRLTASELSVGDDPKTLFAFSDKATELLGGDWVVLEGNSVLLGEGLDERTISDADAQVKVVSWRTVEALIRRLLRNGS